MGKGKDAILRIRLPQELKEQLESIADAKGEAMSVIVREALHQMLEKETEKEAAARSYVEKGEAITKALEELLRHAGKPDATDDTKS